MARTSTVTIRGPHLSIAVVPAPLTDAATVVRAIFDEDISAGCTDVEWQRCGHEHSTSVGLVAVAATAVVATAIALVSSMLSADTLSTVGSSA